MAKQHSWLTTADSLSDCHVSFIPQKHTILQTQSGMVVQRISPGVNAQLHTFDA